MMQQTKRTLCVWWIVNMIANVTKLTVAKETHKAKMHLIIKNKTNDKGNIILYEYE